MDGLISIFGLHYWPYAKPALAILATGLLIWIIWRRVRRPEIRRLAAIGLVVLLFVDIIPSNITLANLCANSSGLVINGRAAHPVSVALPDWASRGGTIFSAILGHFGDLQIEVLEDRYFAGADSPSLEAGFYQLTAVRSTDPQCRSDWNLVSRYLEDDICVRADRIDAVTASHRIDQARWSEFGVQAREVSIVDRRSGEVLGMANRYSRAKGYSWSGLSVFFGEGAPDSVQACPDRLGSDAFDDLFAEVLFDTD